MSFWDPDNRSGSRRLSLGRALPELLQIKEKNYRNFDVPIGTEVTVANLEPVVLHGDQPGGGCGGGDESFFVLDRSNGMSSGGKWTNVVGNIMGGPVTPVS